MGKTCLELGCGPGLVSLAANLAGESGIISFLFSFMHAGATHVIMTDGDTKSVALSTKNAHANACTAVVPRQLRWLA